MRNTEKRPGDLAIALVLMILIALFIAVAKALTEKK